MENERRLAPKLFFNATKRVTKLRNSKAIFAIEFAQGQYKEAPIPFSIYLKNLYWVDNCWLNVIPPIGTRINISMSDLIWATKRLSSNKAIGVDKLRDTHLKFLLKVSPQLNLKML